MQFEKDDDRDVYNGDLGGLSRIWRTASSSPISMAGKSPTALDLDARGERRVRQGSQPVTDQRDNEDDDEMLERVV